MFFPFSCLEVENEKMIWFEIGKKWTNGSWESLFWLFGPESALTGPEAKKMILRLNKSLPFPLPLSLCLPLSLSLCLHLCLNSCLYLTLPLNLKLSFCLCLWLCLCLFQGKSQIGWGFVFVFVFASVSVLVFGRGKSSLLLFSDYPDRGQTVDPDAKIPRLILRLDERAS